MTNTVFSSGTSLLLARFSSGVCLASLLAFSVSSAHGAGTPTVTAERRPTPATSNLLTNGEHHDELKVAKVRRVSHPGYGAGQCTFGIRDPWNYDRSRLMYHEGGS